MNISQDLRDEIITCFNESLLMTIIFDNDYEEYETPSGDFLETVKAAFDDLEYNDTEIEDILNNVDECSVIDEVVCANGEYWRDEYGINNLERYLKGDEFEIAMNNVRKMLDL